MPSDFSGYATRNDLTCSDGRVIRAGAFKENDGQKVPLVWQHRHNEPSNVLGHALLENREDGVYAYGYFNNGNSAKEAKGLLEHGDINALSIYANKLVQQGSDVLHGSIREVSLVLAGANPGAFIDNVTISHSDGVGSEELESEAVIYTGLSLEHEDKTDSEDSSVPGAQADATIKDIFDSMSEEQKQALYYIVGQVTDEASASHSDDSDDSNDENSDESSDDTLQHNEKGEPMTRNVFDKDGDTKTSGATLTHTQIKEIFDDAAKTGSLKESILSHAVTYGIDNIELLFPDAKAITTTPEFIKRRTEWVATVMSGTSHTPFSRIKSLSADITLDTARALGYVKGNLKKEEFFAISKRETTPKTIYKKQKLDRDDIIDITDFDVVAWIKAEMRLMLEEEIARAVLIGDGREPEDPDKIDENKIRPIAKDDNFYTHKVTLASNVSGQNLIKAVLRARKFYKGSGNPTFFTTEDTLTDLLLIEDKLGRRLYDTAASLSAAMRVSNIIPVEVMENFTDGDGNGLIGLLVNLSDYTIGADKGGQTAMFDDFDIDYNQYKYLMETRISGALTKAKTAIAVWRSDGTAVVPGLPTFADNVVTVPTTAGVKFFASDDLDTDLSGTDVTLTAEDNTVTIVAVPNDGYFVTAGAETSWTYNYEA